MYSTLTITIRFWPIVYCHLIILAISANHVFRFSVLALLQNFVLEEQDARLIKRTWPKITAREDANLTRRINMCILKNLPECIYVLN